MNSFTIFRFVNKIVLFWRFNITMSGHGPAVKAQSLGSVTGLGLNVRVRIAGGAMQELAGDKQIILGKNLLK